MAVYTEVSPAQAEALLQRLGLGALTAMQPIRSGIENTNYYVNTASGQWVLTLFERLGAAQLPYYLHLMQHLAEAGIPVPAPQADAQGAVLHEVAGKPAAVVTRLPGAHELAPGASDCAQVGDMLARMHLAGAGFKGRQPNLRGLPWWQATVPAVLPHLGRETAHLLEAELAFQQAQAPAHAALPQGPIHADLFRDNVMFDRTAGESRLCGFFDFYFAGHDALLFDVAVCVNDWCIQHDTGAFEPPLYQAFVSAYCQVRTPSATERAAWPAMLRAAALRFWLSRLWDWYLPRRAALLQPKDPIHFERVLTQRQAHTAALDTLA
jgi:homoserine kinase type II